MLSEALARIAAAKAMQAKQAIKAVNQTNQTNQTPQTNQTNEIIQPLEGASQINSIDTLSIPDVSHINLSDYNLNLPIDLNPEQELAVKLAISGESFVLTGAAGTGKTTTMKAVLSALMQSGNLGKLVTNHKYLPHNGVGAAICAYTRRATNNIRHNLPSEVQDNAVTIHKLLEYAPVEEPSVTADGKYTIKKVFRPGRDKQNPLPSGLTLIVLEEASMISLELYEQIKDALTSHNVQFIYLGDINQLGPVAGIAILGFKLVDLPCVQLSRVYRQALESPIIRLAHRILSGKIIDKSQLPEWTIDGKLAINIFPDSLKDPDIAVQALTGIHSKSDKPTGLKAKYMSGEWNPEEDAIILPFRETPMGVTNFSKMLASMLDTCKEEAPVVHEIITGKGDQYFAEGDLVLYDKERYTISKIVRNGNYTGTRQPRFGKFDRFGNELGFVEAEFDETFMDADAALAAVVASWETMNEADQAKRAASHRVTLRADDGEEIELDTSGALNKVFFAYAITGHESQGLEFRRVFIFVTANPMRNFITNEWLYTAVTRAKENLTIWCTHDTFIKGVTRRQIPGTTLAQKRAYFVRKRMELKSESVKNLVD